MDDEQTLELIPRDVRDKLDRVGIKLHLKDWQAFTLAERQRLRDLACETPTELALYSALLSELIMHYTGRPPQPLKRTS